MRILITESQYSKLIEDYVDFPIDKTQEEVTQQIGLDVWEDDEKLELEFIWIPKESRGMGKGTEIMQMVCDYADKKQKPLYLTPDISFGGSSIDRLKRFYRKFGFTKNKNHKVSHSMVRYPK